MEERRRGVSYVKRVREVNRIYDEHVKSGLSNREIWRRYIYPVFGISERTYYNMLNAPATCDMTIPKELEGFLNFDEDGK